METAMRRSRTLEIFWAEILGVGFSRRLRKKHPNFEAVYPALSQRGKDMNIRIVLRRATLTVLAALPIVSVAFAAESKLTEMEGQLASNAIGNTGSITSSALNSSVLLDPVVLQARATLFAPMTIMTTQDQARARIQSQNPEWSGAEIDQEFQRTVDLLQAKGLLTLNENAMIGKSASGGG